MSGLQKVGPINNTVILIFRYFQCLHLVYSEVAWVLVSSGTELQKHTILELKYFPNYLSVSYDYDYMLLYKKNYFILYMYFSELWKKNPNSV